MTHAMVVPTMLARIVRLARRAERCGHTHAALAVVRRFAQPATVLQRIIELFPDTELTNAYGLTETSSTIAVLGPDDHRAAVTSDDPLVRADSASAGRLLPTIEVELRDNDDVRGGRRSRRHLGAGRAGIR